MLIVLPSAPTTEKAAQWLHEQGIEHEIIGIPESLGYRTGSDIALYIRGDDCQGVPMMLTRARFVVMRVFKDFKR